jgi:hypothetical protein
MSVTKNRGPVARHRRAVRRHAARLGLPLRAYLRSEHYAAIRAHRAKLGIPEEAP